MINSTYSVRVPEMGPLEAPSSGPSVRHGLQKYMGGRHLTERGVTATVTSIQEVEGVFDLILESAGGSSLAGAISKVAPHGTIVLFGNSSIQETPFNLANLVGHAEARLIAFFITSQAPRLPWESTWQHSSHW